MFELEQIKVCRHLHWNDCVHWLWKHPNVSETDTSINKDAGSYLAKTIRSSYFCFYVEAPEGLDETIIGWSFLDLLSVYSLEYQRKLYNITTNSEPLDHSSAILWSIIPTYWPDYSQWMDDLKKTQSRLANLGRGTWVCDMQLFCKGI